MRLLNTKAEPYQLVNFVDQLPTYAILSHQWEEEELSFKVVHDVTISNENNASRKAWLKVEALRKLAAGRGFDWVCVDTCCIYKSSSAKLSEAINSMFVWYNQAGICFVYMSDVSRNDVNSFERSSWFTRGRTLQELLAPRIVEFFDSNWRFLGNRIEICREISRASSVPALIFYDPTENTFENCSVAERMSRASMRETSGAEDKAYRLFGIFDVNMPLLYG